jgi:hypothetical protein
MQTSQLRTLYDLMHAVCEHLSGKKIRLRMIYPGDHLDGVTWCDELGRLTIDIRPHLSDDRLLAVICKHHTFIPVRETVMQASPLDRSHGQSIREDQADDQAMVWMNYALRHRDQALPLLEGSLWQLLTYKDGDR